MLKSYLRKEMEKEKKKRLHPGSKNEYWQIK